MISIYDILEEATKGNSTKIYGCEVLVGTGDE